MKALDSVLNILVQQGGTELRLTAERPPQMFNDDLPLALTIPAMSARHIRELLGDLWTTHETELRQHGRASFEYQSAELGPFAVGLFQADETALEVRVRRDAAHGGVQKEANTHDTVGGVATDPQRDEETGSELPTTLLALLARMGQRGASDIHLSPQQPPIARINGRLDVLDGEAGFDVTPLLTGAGDLDRLRAGGSVDRSFSAPGIGRIRINVYTSAEGLCAAVRVLTREAPPLPELNLPGQIESLVDLPHGLVIACGPTGSGKSTTLAALIQHALRRRPQVLVTLEDPIEYLIRATHPGGLVRQREVGTHVRDFSTGLRDALREDPDILLIGEMRDAETISLALTAAETGHLVFASLHSRTAQSAVERIVDTYPPERQRQIRVQLADSLRAVIAQRLLPTVDGGRRIPAVELLRVSYGVANLIREGRTAQIVNALQGGGADGMLVLERHLAELVRANRVRLETALAVANDAAALSDYLRTPA